MPKLRVILDTNIYGLFLERNELGLADKIISSNKFIVYGNNIIRNELRETPKYKKFGNKNYRSILLQNFDILVGKHIIEITKKTENLAESYFEQFCREGGHETWHKLKDDFLIVACASLKNLDVAVSEDNKSMCSFQATNAYRIVNGRCALRTPTLYGYNDLKKILGACV